MSSAGTPLGPPPGGPPGLPPVGPRGPPSGGPPGPSPGGLPEDSQDNLPPGIIALINRAEPDLIRPLTLIIDVRSVLGPLSRLSTAELGSLIRRASTVMMYDSPLLWMPDFGDLDIFLSESSRGWTLVVRPM